MQTDLHYTTTVKKNKMSTGTKTGLKLFLLITLLFISTPAFAEESFYYYFYADNGSTQAYSIQYEIYTPPYRINTYILPVVASPCCCCGKHYRKRHAIRRRHIRRVIRHRHNRFCRW